MKGKTQGRLDQSSGDQESLNDRLQTAMLARKRLIEAAKEKAAARKAAKAPAAAPAKGAKKPR